MFYLKKPFCDKCKDLEGKKKIEKDIFQLKKQTNAILKCLDQISS